jgi:hypothetical protein
MDSLHMKIVVSKLPQRSRTPLGVFCHDNDLELTFIQKKEHLWSVSAPGWDDRIWICEGSTPIVAAQGLAKCWSDERDEVFLGAADVVEIENATR